MRRLRLCPAQWDKLKGQQWEKLGKKTTKKNICNEFEKFQDNGDLFVYTASNTKIFGL